MHFDTSQDVTHSRTCKSTGSDFAVSAVFHLSLEFCTKCSSITFCPVQSRGSQPHVLAEHSQHKVQCQFRYHHHLLFVKSYQLQCLCNTTV